MRRGPERSLFVSAPVDTPPSQLPALLLARSLTSNSIRDEGAIALASILHKTKITNLQCAATPPSVCFHVSAR